MDVITLQRPRDVIYALPVSMPPKPGCSKSVERPENPEPLEARESLLLEQRNGNVVEEEMREGREGGFQRWGLIRSDDLEGRIINFAKNFSFFALFRMIGVEFNVT